MSLEELRDIVIVVYGVLGILLLLVLIVVAIGLFVIVRRLSRSVQELIADPLRPTLYEFQQTAQNVRGTSEFVADRTVHPLIRTIAVVRGVKRGLSSVSGLRKRGH
jgi:hypothetical protein